MSRAIRVYVRNRPAAIECGYAALLSRFGQAGVRVGSLHISRVVRPDGGRTRAGRPGWLLSQTSAGEGPFRILVVCTANQCRSPLVEFALRRHSAARSLPWLVSSAGTQAIPDEPPHPHVQRLLSAHGDDVDGWRSKRLTAELLDSAHLVLAATVAHRSQIAMLHPSVLRRTYPVLQFAALCRRTPGGLPGLVDGVSWEDRLRTVRAALPHEPRAADLMDPIGRSFRFFRRTDRLVEDAAADVTGQRQMGLRSS